MRLIRLNDRYKKYLFFMLEDDSQMANFFRKLREVLRNDAGAFEFDNLEMTNKLLVKYGNDTGQNAESIEIPRYRLVVDKDEWYHKRSYKIKMPNKKHMLVRRNGDKTEVVFADL